MKTFIIRFTLEADMLAALKKRKITDAGIRQALRDAGYYEIEVLVEKQDADDMGMNAGEYEAHLQRQKDESFGDE